MTFAIAEIIPESGGRIVLLADTKLTDDSDAAATRSIYTKPILKVVIVDDDIAVAVAGNWPKSSIERTVALRGSTLAEIVEHLAQFSGDISRATGAPKSFLVAKRAPAPRLFRIRHGDVDEPSPSTPRLCIGDPAGFSAFQAAYHQQLPNESAERRLVVATQTAVMVGEVESVGGYVTRATGSADHPFRFRSDPSGTGPWEVEGNIVERDGQPVLAMRVPPGVDPTEHTRIGVSGYDDTFGAMAFYSPETRTARLWLHDTPGEPPVQLTGVSSLPELVRRAAQEYGQKLAAVKRVTLADAPMDTALIQQL